MSFCVFNVFLLSEGKFYVLFWRKITQFFYSLFCGQSALFYYMRAKVKHFTARKIFKTTEVKKVDMYYYVEI